MPETDARSAQLVELARLAAARGDGAAAIASFRQAVALDETDGGGPAPETLVALGTLEAEAGELAAAAGHLRDALDRQTAQLGDESPALADTMMRLAAVTASLDDLETAESLLRRAVRVAEPGGAAQLALLNDLARVLVRRGDNAAAEPVLERLHESKAARIGAAHPEVATVVAALAAVRQALGKHESAEQLWREVVEVRERSLAPGHFATSIAIEGLAGACATRGKFAEAVLLLRRAVAMREQTLGAGHASLAQLRARIADLELQAAYADPATEGAASPRSVSQGLMLPLPAIPSARNGTPRAGMQLAPIGPSPAPSPATRIVATRLPDPEQADVGSGPSEAALADALRTLRDQIGDAYDADPRRSPAAPLLLVPEDEELDEEWHEEPRGLGALFARRRVPIIAGAVVLLGAIAAVSFAVQGNGDTDEWVVTATSSAPSLSLAGDPSATSSTALPQEHASAGSVAASTDSTREPAERTASRADRDVRPTRANAARSDEPATPTVQAPAAPAVDLSRVTTAIGRGAGEIDSTAVARPGIRESSRALLTDAAPLRTGVTGGEVGFRSALLDSKGPQPLYPMAMKGTRRRGVATLEFTVDSSGRAAGIARVTAADHPAFAQSVLDALPRMRFIPATENGKPVSQRVVMTFTFVPVDD